MDAVFLIGRILFASIFVLSGTSMHMTKDGVEYGRAKGLPSPEVLVPLSGVIIILAGISVGAGILGDLGALVAIGFLLATMFTMHRFWAEADEQSQQIEMVNFMKNASMIGGALVIFWVFNQAQDAAPLTVTDPLFDIW